MKKTKVKKIKGVPEYNLGTWMTNGLKKLGGDNGLIGGVGKTSSALGVGSQVIGGALGIQQTGAAKFGNAIGDITSNFGPAGQIAGGIIKTLSNTMGGKGSVNQDTGEVTKPTGWMGALFGRSKHDLYTEANMIKNSATASKLTEGMRADYFNNAQNAPILAADGGVIPNTLAYLDDGELGKTPDGTIFEVPEEGKPTDSNLVNIPKGSKILSDKVKMKGTNKTYAEVGKHLMKNKKRIGKYAEGTEQANQMMFDKLVNMQELQKQQEEAVKMSKGGYIPKYAVGTDGDDPVKRVLQRQQALQQIMLLNPVEPQGSGFVVTAPEMVDEVKPVVPPTAVAATYGDPAAEGLNIQQYIDLDAKGRADYLSKLYASMSGDRLSKDIRSEVRKVEDWLKIAKSKEHEGDYSRNDINSAEELLKNLRNNEAERTRDQQLHVAGKTGDSADDQFYNFSQRTKRETSQSSKQRYRKYYNELIRNLGIPERGTIAARQYPWFNESLGREDIDKFLESRGVTPSETARDIYRALSYYNAGVPFDVNKLETARQDYTNGSEIDGWNNTLNQQYLFDFLTNTLGININGSKGVQGLDGTAYSRDRNSAIYEGNGGLDTDQLNLQYTNYGDRQQLNDYSFSLPFGLEVVAPRITTNQNVFQNTDDTSVEQPANVPPVTPPVTPTVESPVTAPATATAVTPPITQSENPLTSSVKPSIKTDIRRIGLLDDETRNNVNQALSNWYSYAPDFSKLPKSPGTSNGGGSRRRQIRVVEKPKADEPVKVTPSKKALAAIGSPLKQRTITNPFNTNYSQLHKAWDVMKSIDNIPNTVKASEQYYKDHLQPEQKPKNNSFDFANLAQLAPSIAGMFPGKAERAVPYTTNAVYGPTQYNINPQLRAYDDSFAAANYNTRNAYPSTGMSLAAGLQNAVNLNNAYAQAYGTKNNAENQLGFQNANIANSTNQYNAQARHLAAVENTQNGAARRNIIRSAERDLATSIAGMRKDDRGFTMNQAMWAAMSPYMQYGMTNANYNNMNQYMTKAIRNNGD